MFGRSSQFCFNICVQQHNMCSLTDAFYWNKASHKEIFALSENIELSPGSIYFYMVVFGIVFRDVNIIYICAQVSKRFV